MENLKKIFLFICIFLLISPLPVPGMDGAYNKVSGFFWCKNQHACIHEIGHKLDDEDGWISHSDEFESAVELYAGYDIERGILNKNIEEIYARLFEHSGGVSENMPELLRPFYDWDRAQELIEKVMR